MRATRRLTTLTTGLLASALLGAAALQATTALPQSSGSTTQVDRAAALSPAAAHVAARKKARKARVQGFSYRTVRAIPGRDRITVVWPARVGATGYTVEWAPTGETLATTPAGCRWPCKRKFTRATSMVLTAADLSSYGRLVSSRSGNTLRFKVFAHNGTAVRSTGPSAWIGPSATTGTNWLPSPNSAMPSALPPAAGTGVGITSFNVLTSSDWLNRANKVAAQINATGATIVATQENSNASIYGDTSQFEDLARRLSPSGWQLADDRNWDYVLGDVHSRSTQAVRIYYKRDTWRQVDNGALMTRVPIDGSPVNENRWISWSKLQSVADPATKVCVVDLHLLTNLSTNYTPSAVHRNAEIAQLLSEWRNPSSTIRRVGTRVGEACGTTPTVVAGDFNAAQAHAPWGNMPVSTLLQAGFVDTKNAGVRYNTKWTGPGTVSGWHETFGTQIDYLLGWGVGGARSFKVNFTMPADSGSDHFPITAVVNVPQS